MEVERTESDTVLLTVERREIDKKIVVSVHQPLLEYDSVALGIVVADIVRNLCKALNRPEDEILTSMLIELDDPTSDLIEEKLQ